MRTEDDVILCSAAGADALGFIFASSPARLDVTVAAHIARQAPAAVERVGVFAEQDRALICDAIERVELDVLQFCGGESAEFRGSFGLPTIVVVGVGRQGARSALPAPASLAMARACAILIDSHHGAVLGGTGMRIDTHLATSLCAESPLPCILAGGLRPENVARAIADVRPRAVDVRSGVERDGQKDERRVRAFIHAAKAAMSATR